MKSPTRVSESTEISVMGEVMAARSRGGTNGEDGEPVARWRAEEAVAGNRMALQALRELVIYPFLYARQSRLLGLKVLPPAPFSSTPSNFIV